MKTVGANYEILDKTLEMSEIQFIEKVARTCYQSEHKITEDGSSAIQLVDKLICSGHEAMLEHQSIIFEISYETYKYMQTLLEYLESCCSYRNFLRMTNLSGHRCILSGNVRAWRNLLTSAESCNGLPVPYVLVKGICGEDGDISREVLFGDILDVKSVRNQDYSDADWCYEIEKHELLDSSKYSALELATHYDLSVKFVCDRGISHEIVRHRVDSFAQESTRYCNYSNDKFTNECTFIDISPGMSLDKKCSTLTAQKLGDLITEWQRAMEDAEKHYMNMLNLGAPAQIARSVLPNSTKTEIVVTSSLKDWKHFFELRTAPVANPQMKEISIPLEHEMIERFPTVFEQK